jgi:hypothetical protein
METRPDVGQPRLAYARVFAVLARFLFKRERDRDDAPFSDDRSRSLSCWGLAVGLQARAFARTFSYGDNLRVASQSRLGLHAAT